MPGVVNQETTVSMRSGGYVNARHVAGPASAGPILSPGDIIKSRGRITTKKEAGSIGRELVKCL